MAAALSLEMSTSEYAALVLSVPQGVYVTLPCTAHMSSVDQPASPPAMQRLGTWRLGNPQGSASHALLLVVTRCRPDCLIFCRGTVGVCVCVCGHDPHFFYAFAASCHGACL